MAELGVETFGIHGVDIQGYEDLLIESLKCRPHLIVDDGGDLISPAGGRCAPYGDRLLGGCEETTTGIHRLYARQRAGILPCPMMAVNDAKAKHYYDNKYGTGQSSWDAIMHTTNLMVAGKTVVVAGYGWCGKGIAMRAKGMGADVIVTEVDPFKALEATMENFRVMPMDEAATIRRYLCHRHRLQGRDRGAPLPDDEAQRLLCNSGHFDCEVDVAALGRWRRSASPAGQASRASACPTAAFSTCWRRGGWSTWPPETATRRRSWICPSPSRPFPWSGWPGMPECWRRRSTTSPKRSTTRSAG